MLRGLQTVMNWGVLPWFREQYRLVTEHYEPGNTLVVSAALATGRACAASAPRVGDAALAQRLPQSLLLEQDKTHAW